MPKLMHCPFCGGEYFLFGKDTSVNYDEIIRCPDCGTMATLGRLEKYRHLKPQKFLKWEAEA